jgi:tetratricopeptide (TPR) repeat protein
MSDKRKRCERCGNDLTIYKKVFSASNHFYNDGLARAKVRDLSGAIISLRKSLELNKLNINARNLLGLVYYEMGEMVAAISEWVISKHFKPEDNDADEYINKVQSNLTKLDSLNQAIKRYNTALGFAKQGSDDLAIIQLKKVVNLNVNFIRAYQLLVLLLIKTGEKDKARKYLQKIAKIDVTNTTTLKYLKEIEVAAAVKDLNSNPEAEQPPSTGAIMPISSYREDKPNVMAYVNLVIGIVIGLAVAAFLIVPTIKKNVTSDNDSGYADIGYTAEQIQQKDDLITQLQAEKEQLEKDKKDLQTQIDTLNKAEDKDIYTGLIETTIVYMAELEKSKSQQDLITVADSLANIDDTKLEAEAAKQLYQDLKTVTFPEAAKNHYEKGHSLYTQGKYEEALVQLKQAMKFDPEDVDAVYFAARAYHRLDDKSNAAVYYNQVINDFPDSSRVADANDYLKDVQE